MTKGQSMGQKGRGEDKDDEGTKGTKGTNEHFFWKRTFFSTFFGGFPFSSTFLGH